MCVFNFTNTDYIFNIIFLPYVGEIFFSHMVEILIHLGLFLKRYLDVFMDSLK